MINQKDLQNKNCELNVKNVYSDITIDIFREIANVGIGSAANSLSTMISATLFVGTPEVYIIPVEKVTELMGSPEELVTGIYLSVKGDVNGAVLMIIPFESARSILEIICPVDNKDNPQEFNGDEISAISEVGNIIGCSYLNAIGELLGITVIPSVPAFAYDMLGAIIDFSLIDLGGIVENAMIFETNFFERKGGVKGYFIFLPDECSTKKLLDSARDKYGVSDE